MDPIRLPDDQLEQLADILAERFSPTRSPAMLDARELAEALKCDLSFIYANAERLGGHRLGGGKQGRFRFDLSEAKAALRIPPTAPPRSPRRRSMTPKAGKILRSRP